MASSLITLYTIDTNNANISMRAHVMTYFLYIISIKHEHNFTTPVTMRNFIRLDEFKFVSLCSNMNGLDLGYKTKIIIICHR